MPFLIYVAVFLAALVSVLMGLDRVAPPARSPSAQSRAVEPPRPMPGPPVQRAEGTSQPAPRQPAAPVNVPELPPQPPIIADQPDTTAQSTEDPAPSGCNVPACSTAYRSFRASDCTYMRLSGARVLCKK